MDQKQKQDDSSLKVLTHILGLLVGFLGPLIILLVTEDEEVKKHAKKALNWQISVIIYMIVSVILIFVIIGLFLLIALIIIDIVFCIMAATKASKEELWNYPLAIPFL